MKEYDLVIAGAGPAGLYAAAKCGAAGIKTALIESMDSPGRKLLLSGQGRCNITNSVPVPDFINHFGKKRNFVRKCIYSFSNRDLMDFLNTNGMKLLVRDDGKVFPESQKSADVLKLFIKLSDNSYTDHFYKTRITEIYRDHSDNISDGKCLFRIKAENGQVFRSAFMLIATGGFTFPSTGSAGDGYRFAEAFGHRIIQPKPSLTPVVCYENDFTSCSGTSLYADTSLLSEGHVKYSKSGDLLFTHTGLSGPVIIDNSREICEHDVIRINLLPGYNRDELSSKLLQFCTANGSKTVKTFFTDMHDMHITSGITASVFNRAGVRFDRKASELTKQERTSLVSNFTALKFTVKNTEGRNKAMCTAGGIDTDEINPAAMESKIINGLYFAGEVIDVDGDSGGYNLQFAFSSADSAASAIIKILKPDINIQTRYDKRHKSYDGTVFCKLHE